MALFLGGDTLGDRALFSLQFATNLSTTLAKLSGRESDITLRSSDHSVAQLAYVQAVGNSSPEVGTAETHAPKAPRACSVAKREVAFARCLVPFSKFRVCVLTGGGGRPKPEHFGAKTKSAPCTGTDHAGTRRSHALTVLGTLPY